MEGKSKKISGNSKTGPEKNVAEEKTFYPAKKRAGISPIGISS